MTGPWKIVKHVPGRYERGGLIDALFFDALFEPQWKEAYNVWVNDDTGQVQELPVGETPQEGR